MTSADTPIAGYYRVKLCARCPWLPVTIYHRASQEDRSPMWIAVRDGEYVDVFEVWPGCSAQPVTEREYNFLISTRQHDKVYGHADPRKPIDLNRIKTVF